MERVAVASTMTWCEKTMTLMKEKQLEACDKRLSAYPQKGIFSGCSALDVQTWWEMSYYAQEGLDQERLYALKELQQMVLDRIEREVCLVSMAEYQLLERMILFNGETELMDWSESGAAESLVKRLWCTIRWEGERVYLCLPKVLHTPVLSAMSNPDCAQLRERLFRFDATIHGLLYIAGFLHGQQPMEHFLHEVTLGQTQIDRTLAYRYLCTTFDYAYDRRGDMILIHPGLADPEHLLKQMEGAGAFELELTETMVLGGMNGIFPQEEPLFQAMVGTLQGSVRPEYTEEDAATDLRLLAKQGVALHEMEDVLASMLMVVPSRAMLSVLEQICQQTPRWAGLSSKLIN